MIEEFAAGQLSSSLYGMAVNGEPIVNAVEAPNVL
jgi:hypothetical protein